MHTGFLVSVPLLAAAFVGALQVPQKPAPAGELVVGKMDPALLQKLTWVCGTWVQQKGKTTIEEHWRPLQGTTILGTSHTFDDQKSSFFEFLRIGHRAGSISYVAMPGGAPPTLFRLVKVEDGLMVFENEKHDHPQRIRYERTKDGMTATISQLDGSRATAFVFKKKD
jgi:hypothetical protein